MVKQNKKQLILHCKYFLTLIYLIKWVFYFIFKMKDPILIPNSFTHKEDKHLQASSLCCYCVMPGDLGCIGCSSIKKHHLIVLTFLQNSNYNIIFAYQHEGSCQVDTWPGRCAHLCCLRHQAEQGRNHCQNQAQQRCQDEGSWVDCSSKHKPFYHGSARKLHQGGFQGSKHHFMKYWQILNDSDTVFWTL